jgi:hypothetical protein
MYCQVDPSGKKSPDIKKDVIKVVCSPDYGSKWAAAILGRPFEPLSASGGASVVLLHRPLSARESYSELPGRRDNLP